MQNNKPIEINGDCQFFSDLTGNPTIARYNLIVVTGQLKLYSKGIKPSRHFRLKDIKNYFGVTGNLESITSKINAISGVVEEVVKGVKNNKHLTNKGGCNDE